ncbi:hypothetical protein SDC9_147831 [bioreactor metagenome]|uniref:Uncharacterized protein n=1 Tax=bioreactor metagenome TaxID=1076179 RepID=A0A645EF11_9ZZZZ
MGDTITAATALSMTLAKAQVIRTIRNRVHKVGNSVSIGVSNSTNATNEPLLCMIVDTLSIQPTMTRTERFRLSYAFRTSRTPAAPHNTINAPKAKTGGSRPIAVIHMAGIRGRMTHEIFRMSRAGNGGKEDKSISFAAFSKGGCRIQPHSSHTKRNSTPTMIIVIP